jgi:hypothetical protein
MSEYGGSLLWEVDERGRSCVGLEYHYHGALFLVQLVGVVPHGIYKVGGELRGENIEENAFGALQVAFRDEYGGLTEDALSAPKGRLIIGSTDWSHDMLEVKAPQHATAAELRILITGKGRLWARNLMMTQG